MGSFTSLVVRVRFTLLSLTAVVAASGTVHAGPKTDRLLEQGDYGSGLASLALEDTTRPTPPNGTFPGSATRPLPTLVWYPAADRSKNDELGATPATSDDGFPLIVFGHGITSQAAAGSFVAAHLATHGYIVVGPDFPLSKLAAPGGPTARDIPGQAGDVVFLINAFQSPALQANFPVAAQIDFDRIGVLGYSLGGATMSLAGTYPAIDAVATLAPATCPLYQSSVETNLEKPSFILQGTTDAIVRLELNAEPLFDSSADPRYLVTIENGSHGGFLTQAPGIEAMFPTTPLDGVLCQSLLPVLGSDPIAQACGVCNPLPAGPQLASLRQQDLTRAGVLAFFEGYLRCSPSDAGYLKQHYDRENDELTTNYSGQPGNGKGHCAAP